eukprot:TRINITY_DN215_c0_g1_i5.p1 TRINITY_DN215_c0_g1~~TRINITY_DN215_c0_g1_i5.p1  ORF type:complete len:243 (-),score=30.08 TRINITY_DN215_c0_g1_i5:247-975(-)
MLAVFQHSVAEGPRELQSPVTPPKGSRIGRYDTQGILRKFKDAHPSAVVMQFNDHNGLACASGPSQTNISLQFSSMDNIFCCFIGCLENLPHLRQLYGLPKGVNEPQFLIEAYKTLRDRKPYPPDQVIQELQGPFAFILFDHTTTNVFIAADFEGKVPLYWGKTMDDDVLAISNESAVLKAGCGTSFAPFPKGCYYTSKEQLRSYEHPNRALKPVQHVDSQGQLCGATFKVDSQPDLQDLDK